MKAHGLLSVKQTLENRLIYGSYPDIMNHETDAKELLYNLSNSYLYKDLLNLESVRRPACCPSCLLPWHCRLQVKFHIMSWRKP